jgi:hypothetical protein
MAADMAPIQGEVAKDKKLAPVVACALALKAGNYL